jgi:hypothetical protein
VEGHRNGQKAKAIDSRHGVRFSVLVFDVLYGRQRVGFGISSSGSLLRLDYLKVLNEWRVR